MVRFESCACRAHHDVCVSTLEYELKGTEVALQPQDGLREALTCRSSSIVDDFSDFSDFSNCSVRARLNTPWIFQRVARCNTKKKTPPLAQSTRR